MFDLSAEKLIVLAVLAVILLGPERLPVLARDLARMLRQLRELATGARAQFRDELGPEFADVDLAALRELRSLNPRTAISRALLAEDEPTNAPAVVAEVPAPPSVPSHPLGRAETAPFDTDAT